jgi:hypothetical protein
MKYFALLAFVSTLTGRFRQGPNEGQFTLSDNVQLSSRN